MIVHDSAGRVAKAALRRLVIEGRYQPGDRLPPERELADALGFSRPTVRETIRRLIEGGLLEARHGSGTFVADVDLDAVFAVRLQLEPYAASLAATSRSREVRARLAALVKELGAHVDDIDAFAATDTEIHRTIAEASGNQVLCDTLDRLTDLASVSRAITSSAEQTRKQTLRQMRSLVRAIRTRNAEDAAAAMEAHLQTVRTSAASGTSRQHRLALGPTAAAA